MIWILSAGRSGYTVMWWKFFRLLRQIPQVRVEFFGDEVDRIAEFDPLTGEVKAYLMHTAIFPASHYVVPPEQMERAIKDIEAGA